MNDLPWWFNVSDIKRRSSEILLVDDDTDTTDILTEALEAVGYRVRLAQDGQEGLAHLEKGFPDMVVLDVEMPVLDGPTMAKRMFLKNLGREKIPILLCSGILNLQIVAARVGTPYFLGKPYTLDAMLKSVARVLLERIPPTPQSRSQSQ
jgi:DNA-binding NtrC family response regulator